MSLFLGIFPDEKSNYKIRKVVGEVGSVFDGFDIDVRWINPERYHILLQFLGESNPIKDLYYTFKLKGTKIDNLEVTLSDLKLGNARSHRGLVYLAPSVGGEALRNTVFDLRKKLGIVDSRNFIPQLTLGRVSKDLTDQEYSNISKILEKKDFKANISFNTSTVYLVREKEGEYSLVKEYK
jgi:2'-5' RNA ligase